MKRFDVLVIGGGPAGTRAAEEAAAAGRAVLLIEQDRAVGGECVRRGTIPSKTLRETAQALVGFRRRSGDVVPITLPPDTQLQSLMIRKHQVIDAHEERIDAELRTSGIERWHGRARFLAPLELEVVSVGGAVRRAIAPVVLIATGSRPRSPPEVPIDHEHVLDSDSILSMSWLPRRLTVLGAGVIASEYASVFAALGVEVTMIDRAPRPMGFLDEELTSRFVTSFEGMGGRFLGGCQIRGVAFDGLSQVRVTLESGEHVLAEKVLCALGRVAAVEGLGLEAAGLRLNGRGVLDVDANGMTSSPGVYAAGDVIGPPSLASSSMDQGRRAIRHALGLPNAARAELIPAGVYTIPELSSVGLTEQQARALGPVTVGRAPFERIARGQISANEGGLLKLVCDGEGRRVIGVHVFGEGAAELVHLGELAMTAQLPVDVFVDGIFNFPTLAEAYRVAALEIVRGRKQG